MLIVFLFNIYLTTSSNDRPRKPSDNPVKPGPNSKTHQVWLFVNEALLVGFSAVFPNKTRWMVFSVCTRVSECDLTEKNRRLSGRSHVGMGRGAHGQGVPLPSAQLQGKFFGRNFQVKNAGFYAKLLVKILLVARNCDQGGLMDPPWGRRCKTHGGLKIYQWVSALQTPRQLAVWNNWICSLLKCHGIVLFWGVFVGVLLKKW